MNGFHDFDGFHKALGRPVPDSEWKPRYSYESPAITLAPVKNVNWKFLAESPEGVRLFHYVRFALPLWDFRSGDNRVYWGKLYKIGSDGSIDPAAPKTWRWMRGEFYPEEVDLSKHGGWADAP